MRIKDLQELNKIFQGVVGVDYASGPDKTVIQITPETKVYILAGEYRHAEWFAGHIHLSKKQYKFVREPQDLYGVRGIVIYYETWMRHERSNEINGLVRILKERGVVQVYKSDEFEKLLVVRP